jgi:TonB family protein
MRSEFQHLIAGVAGLAAAGALLAPGLCMAQSLAYADPAAARWTAAVERRLDRALAFPAQVVREHGVAEVGFRVDAAGQLSGVHLERSSGSATLDGAALAAAERLGPLPPAPAFVQARRVVVRAEFQPSGRRAERPALNSTTSALRARGASAQYASR